MGTIQFVRRHDHELKDEGVTCHTCIRLLIRGYNDQEIFHVDFTLEETAVLIKALIELSDENRDDHAEIEAKKKREETEKTTETERK